MSVYPSTIQRTASELLHSAESVDAPNDRFLQDQRRSEMLAALTLNIAQGRIQETLSLIAPLLDSALERGDQRTVDDLRLLRDIAALEQRRLACHRGMIPMADTRNTIRLMVEFGEHILPLLRQVATTGSNPLISHSIDTTAFSGERQDLRNGSATHLPSRREQQVLCLISTGRSNRAIASELFISEGTVKKHISSLLEKLGASNRTEAVAIARSIGLLQSIRVTSNILETEDDS